LIDPADGATGVDVSQLFSWTAVAEAQVYYLYVGTAPGRNDLVNTGELTRTTYRVPALPSGTTLYARMWTKAGGVWRYVDSTFTAAPPPPPPTAATFVYPSDGATNVDLRRAAEWTSVAGAEAYYLYVGTAPGLKDLIDSGETQSTTRSMAGLPGGQMAYARLWTKHAGVWRSVDIRFTPAPIAALTFPRDGATNVDPTRAFTWTPVADAQAYYLYVGTTPGTKNLVDSAETQQVTFKGSVLPSGATLFARLWTKHGGAWRYVDSSFSTGSITAATLIYPASGAVNVDVSQPMTWTPVPGAEAYYLYAGTSPGGKDLINTGEIQRTSQDAGFLAGWVPRSSVAWDPAADEDGPTVGYALILDSQRTDFGFLPPTTCQGDSGPTSCYQITLPPLAPGDHSIQVSAYNFVGETLSAPTVLSEPGRTVFVRLWTKLNGVWRFTDSHFTPSHAQAEFIYPMAGAVNVDVTRPLQWTAVAAADAYSLTIGSTPGGRDIVDLPALTTTSMLLPTLPGYRALYARLGTGIGGVWQYRELTFAASPATARLSFPSEGATVMETTEWFSWTSVPNAQSYYLYVGTTPGAKDIADSGETLQTTFEVTNLPAGATLHVRLWTKTGGVWRFVDSTFNTQAVESEGPPRVLSTITSPQDQAGGLGSTIVFEWTSVPEALGYHLHLGTFPGDDSFGMSPDYTRATAFEVAGLPPGTVIYVRLYTQYEIGDWSHFTDIVVTTGGGRPD
jgi:hypothetical protein